MLIKYSDIVLKHSVYLNENGSTSIFGNVNQDTIVCIYLFTINKCNCNNLLLMSTIHK